MYDLNLVLDGLREVMFYVYGLFVRKLFKIVILLLVKNYIFMLNNLLEEMKKLVSDIYQSYLNRLRVLFVVYIYYLYYLVFLYFYFLFIMILL